MKKKWKIALIILSIPVTVIALAISFLGLAYYDLKKYPNSYCSWFFGKKGRGATYYRYNPACPAEKPFETMPPLGADCDGDCWHYTCHAGCDDPWAMTIECGKEKAFDICPNREIIKGANGYSVSRLKICPDEPGQEFNGACISRGGWYGTIFDREKEQCEKLENYHWLYGRCSLKVLSKGDHAWELSMAECGEHPELCWDEQKKKCAFISEDTVANRKGKCQSVNDPVLYIEKEKCSDYHRVWDGEGCVPMKCPDGFVPSVDYDRCVPCPGQVSYSEQEVKSYTLEQVTLCDGTYRWDSILNGWVPDPDGSLIVEDRSAFVDMDRVYGSLFTHVASELVKIQNKMVEKVKE